MPKRNRSDRRNLFKTIEQVERRNPESLAAVDLPAQKDLTEMPLASQLQPHGVKYSKVYRILPVKWLLNRATRPDNDPEKTLHLAAASYDRARDSKRFNKPFIVGQAAMLACQTSKLLQKPEDAVNWAHRVNGALNLPGLDDLPQKEWATATELLDGARHTIRDYQRNHPEG